MWKTILTIAICVLTIRLANAENGDLEIKMVNSSKVEAVPGSTVNIVLSLINHTQGVKYLYLKMKAPEGWNQLNDSTLIIVEGESQELKIFSFYIQETTKMGEYSIDIAAYDKADNGKFGEIKASILVKPKYDISVRCLSNPTYVFAGDKLNIQFLVQNLSNTKINVQADIISINVIEHKRFSLAQDSFIIIDVNATAMKDITHYIRNSVSITASVMESPDVKSDVACLFDVAPFNQEKFDAYERIPVKVSGLLVINDQFANNKTASMFNIKGSGVISKRKNSSIEFQLKGPDRQGNPILGTTDEYYAKYTSNKSRAVVGDNVYTLSPLTETSRFGRGVEYEHKLKKVSTGSFLNFPRFYSSISHVYSLYGGYYPFKFLRFDAGYLYKKFTSGSNANLYTISTKTNPVKWSNFEFEYAMGNINGQVSKAYSVGMAVNYFKTRTFFNYNIADKDFPGYFSDSRYISTGINTNVLKKISLSANYNSTQLNLAIDTIYSNAPYGKSTNISIGYSLNFNNNISLGAFRNEREDMRIPKQFYYNENTLRLTFQSQIRQFNLRMYGAYGKTNNLLASQLGEVKSIINGDFSLDYKVNRFVFLRGFISYLGSQKYLTNNFANLFYGGVANLRYRKLYLEFQFQNNYEVKEIYRDRSLLRIKGNYFFNRRHEFSADVSYNIMRNYVNDRQFVASLYYTYTINVPISKKEDVGSLDGKISNKGVDNVDRIVITVDGNMAITNKNGEFEFSALSAGSHLLFIDNSNSGINSITENPGPYKIMIVAGQKSYFEIGLTKSGNISGKIIVEEDANSKNKGYIPVSDEISTLIIEANNGTEVYRIFSNRDKTFTFNDLRPGQWKVKVYDRGIPAGYKLVNDEFMVTLKPEMTENVDVVIKKSSRKIIFQKM